MKVKVKVRSYIARYPVHRTAQSALHFTPWQTCSFQGHLNFFELIGEILSSHDIFYEMDVNWEKLYRAKKENPELPCSEEKEHELWGECRLILKKYF